MAIKRGVARGAQRPLACVALLLLVACQPAPTAAPTTGPPPTAAPQPKPAVSPIPSPSASPAASPSPSPLASPSPRAAAAPPTGQLTIDLAADPESLDP